MSQSLTNPASTTAAHSYAKVPDLPALSPAFSANHALPDTATGKKRRLGEPFTNTDVASQDKDVHAPVEPDIKTPRSWEKAYREAKSGYLKLKGDLLTMKEQLLAKDTKLIERDKKLIQHESLILGARQETIQAKQVINQRDQTINDLELEMQNLKTKLADTAAVQSHLHKTIASLPPARRPHVPTHIPSLDPSIRNRNDYAHADAPRKNLKDYRRFKPQLYYPFGNGKVGPGKYGSNGFWDLGLCHVHFQTEHVCEHREKCEYRHRKLTLEEKQYVGFLTKGLEFLRRSDELVMRKAKAKMARRWRICSASVCIWRRSGNRRVVKT